MRLTPWIFAFLAVPGCRTSYYEYCVIDRFGDKVFIDTATLSGRVLTLPERYDTSFLCYIDEKNKWTLGEYVNPLEGTDFEKHTKSMQLARIDSNYEDDSTQDWTYLFIDTVWLVHQEKSMKISRNRNSVRVKLVGDSLDYYLTADNGEVFEGYDIFSKRPVNKGKCSSSSMFEVAYVHDSVECNGCFCFEAMLSGHIDYKSTLDHKTGIPLKNVYYSYRRCRYLRDSSCIDSSIIMLKHL